MQAQEFMSAGYENGHQTQDKTYSQAFRQRYQLDFPPIDIEAIHVAVRQILSAVGENVQREGLQRTPVRVAKAFEELLAGYRTDPAQLINGALFHVDYDDPVIVRNIEFFSLCEHHMLPFFGHVHVAYIPNGRVIGLSKIPRIVDMFARRLQVQEELTRQISSFIDEVLEPKGVMVVVEGVHMCSVMRGIKKQDAQMRTSARRGILRENPQLEAAVFALLGLDS
ncbi:MAG TPA: GTP cyclohydrolase I FolE [Spirillospora sp.]|nr:GTP cyclohydrolase I FolE [Spirillospora sp.]